MKTLSIDIETYSDVPLSKTGVYRYCESPDFEILLFGYSVDSGPVHVVDLACGEKIPEKIVAALEDETKPQWILYSVMNSYNALLNCRISSKTNLPTLQYSMKPL